MKESFQNPTGQWVRVRLYTSLCAIAEFEMTSTDLSLPTDAAFLPEVTDRSAWYGSDLSERSDWIEHLSASEIAEVQSAVQQLTRSSRDLTSIGRDDFPLPTLGPRLPHLLDEVLTGR